MKEKLPLILKVICHIKEIDVKLKFESELVWFEAEDEYGCKFQTSKQVITYLELLNDDQLINIICEKILNKINWIAL